MSDQYAMNGKTVLITGSTGGIGRITAEKMARAGATVLVHGPSADKVDAAVAEIRKATGNDRVHGYAANFGKLSEVRALGDTVLSQHPELDVLINNAGIGPGSPDKQSQRLTSEDGYELIFQVNYLATALLSQLLLPALKRTRGRLINIASEAQAPLDFEDLTGATGFGAYAHSKLAVVLFSLYFAEQVRDDHVNVYALDPGSFLNTRMVQETWGPSSRNPEIGANAHMYLACSPELASVTGQFFIGQRASTAHGQAYDPAAQEQLWRTTAQLLLAKS